MQNWQLADFHEPKPLVNCSSFGRQQTGRFCGKGMETSL
jgi:hypothetical protein